jgi:hypothetical protein
MGTVAQNVVFLAVRLSGCHSGAIRHSVGSVISSPQLVSMETAWLPLLGCLEQYRTATVAVLVLKCDVAVNGGVAPMTKQISVFNPKTFLSTTGAGRDMMSFRRGVVLQIIWRKSVQVIWRTRLSL